MLRGTTIVILAMSVALAAFIPVSSGASFNFPIHILDRTLSILQCGLLIALFFFSRYFSLSWRSPVFGIALGLGIFASVELAASAVLSQVGYSAHVWLDLVKMGTYHCCVVIWIFYLTVADSETSRVSKTLPEHNLDTWNREIERLLQQ